MNTLKNADTWTFSIAHNKLLEHQAREVLVIINFKFSFAASFHFHVRLLRTCLSPVTP
jgi:hypothetical protein